MTMMLLHSSPFAVRFWHRFGFEHHRKAWRRRSNPTCGPSGRFSTRFGRFGRCANLHQNAGHHATYLSRGDRTLLAFPWTQNRLTEMLGQQQLIASTGHDPTPAFDLRRCAWVQSKSCGAESDSHALARSACDTRYAPAPTGYPLGQSTRTNFRAGRVCCHGRLAVVRGAPGLRLRAPRGNAGLSSRRPAGP